MIERTEHYTSKLSIAQIEACERMQEFEFENWIKGGKSLKFIERFIENEHARAHVGQIPPSSAAASVRVDGKPPVVTAENPTFPKIGEFGLDMQPNRQPTAYDIEAADDAFKKFLATYQQLVPNEANATKIYKFINTRGGIGSFKNFVIAFEKLFGQLELRNIVKKVHEPTTKLTNRRGQRTQINPAFFPRPTTSELVETVLSPSEVRALSADDTAKFLAPMQFAQVTTSADEYRNSDEFKAETPKPLSRREREQTPAQVQREIEVFCNAYPDYAKYAADASKYDGLNQRVLEAIDGWGLLVTASSLKDGYDYAASAGWIPKAVDRADGRVSTFKVTPDLNPPATNAGSIKYHGKFVRDMSSAELQQAMNSSPEFRALLDSTF
jgi:hypothetical protein